MFIYFFSSPFTRKCYCIVHHYIHERYSFFFPTAIVKNLFMSKSLTFAMCKLKKQIFRVRICKNYNINVIILKFNILHVFSHIISLS